MGVKVGWRMRAIAGACVSPGARVGEFGAWLRLGKVWVGLLPIFQVHAPRPGTRDRGDLGHSGKAPSLGLDLVDK